MKNSFKSLLFIVFISSIFSEEENNLESYFDLYDQIFNTFISNYVDTLDKTNVVKESLDGMFNAIDPYTKLYIGSKKDNLEILTKGKYGGIGMQIGLVNDTLTVISCYEDSPSYFEGIQAGDQILMVDTTSTIGLSSSESSNMIRGELGTKVDLNIRRPYLDQNIVFTLERANIIVKDVPYWEVNDDGVGYIRIKKFSRNTAKDFRLALNDILKNSNTKGLIIDLRSNTGGLLSNALNILDQLVPKGENILKTRGRIEKANRDFKAKYNTKIQKNFPIVVLINRSSASASEIVSGTLQDLDLALVVGQSSFGKGLVQRIYNINDTTSLKVTTSKYYTPSGRLIQKMDYLDNDVLTDGLEDRDSIFFTKNGRKVKGGGGINPDIEMDKEKVPFLVQALYRDRIFLTFVSKYAYENALDLPIEISDRILNDFIKYAKNINVEYDLPGEKELKELILKLDEKYTDDIKKSYKERILKPDENYAIVDAQRWLRIKNGSGKTIRIIPPSKHNYNSGEYFYTDLGEIVPKVGFNEYKTSELDYLTESLDKYFTTIKLYQFNDKTNLRWIRNALLREFSSVLGGEKEKIKASLLNDKEYIEASRLILDSEAYKEYIEPQD
tara:strand:- start:1346 stop:3184 length:1839 start_codon:yes stop_codon:yes gene_type:complete